MSQLKQSVIELFEQDQQLIALEKEIKVKNAQYHHLILKNTEKIYSDDEVMAINAAYEDLARLEAQRSVFRGRIGDIKNFLKSRLAPLAGGRWVHETADPIHPRWEFWVEDEDLKYGRLNGANY
jgi:hypothetical protein